LEKQAQVIAGSERALALYVAALQELAEADESLRKLQDTHLQMMQQAVQLGEEDRLSLNGVQIQSSVVARARLDALARSQSALGELEDAVQRPLDPGDLFPVNLESPALNKLTQESKR
jgi:cobalt-zinc-cadmium efflux system outer membrane protein